MNRIVRLFVATLMMGGLFTYANQTGVMGDVLLAAGVPADKVPLVISAAEYKTRQQTKLQNEALKVLKDSGAGQAAQAEARKQLESAQSELLSTGTEQAKKSVEQAKASLAPKVAPKPAAKSGVAKAGPAVVITDKATFKAYLGYLSKLSVKGRGSMTGYSREQFGSSWTDTAGGTYARNGCDTRNDMLGRDLTKVVFKAGTRDCKVLSGVLPYEPYIGTTNRPFDISKGYAYSLDAEHIIALGNAWVSGGAQLSKDKRTALANDPDNLMMVDPSANRQKGDGDAATWLPKNKAYRCTYIVRQVKVKARYGLSVATAERDVMKNILTGCAK